MATRVRRPMSVIGGKAGVTRTSRDDPMYGPAVRCKWILSSWRCAVLHQCIRPLIGACCAPGHHGYQHACDLISGKASSGPFGSSVFACAGKTEPPSRFILSQTSAGKVYRSGYVIVGSSLCALAAFLGVESRSSRLGGGRRGAHAQMGEYRPCPP